MCEFTDRNRVGFINNYFFLAFLFNLEPYHHCLPLFSAPSLVITHIPTPPLSLSLLSLPLSSLCSPSICFVFFLLLFASLVVIYSLPPSSDRPIHPPTVRPGLALGREGGLQWMSIPVVSEVTAAQRSHWQQHWTPQFAHAGMCDIVTVQSDRNSRIVHCTLEFIAL